MTRREQRLQEQGRTTARYLASRGQRSVLRLPNPVGLKLWFVPGSEDADTGRGVLTPYARKELCRRRHARKLTHESRRVNHQRC